MSLTREQADKLLKLARTAIQKYLDHGDYYTVSEPEKWMQAHLATFVTLTIDGELRGCIGHLMAVQDLYKDVIDNAVSAAFRDPRFGPLRKEELPKIKIEVSVLSPPRKLAYRNTDELLGKLNHRLGVILSSGIRSATFLPQVWEDLPDKKEFLAHLCLKAGLPPDEWKNRPGIEVYGVEAFREK
jgi:AmmeMemoRadiSam system protein A